MASFVRPPLQENQLIIDLNDAGMNYYINSLFASDFIHDFGGTSNPRLNSLGRKVDELMEMIKIRGDGAGAGLVGGISRIPLPFKSNDLDLNDFFQRVKENTNLVKELSLSESKSEPEPEYGLEVEDNQLLPSKTSLGLIQSEVEPEPEPEPEPETELNEELPPPPPLPVETLSPAIIDTGTTELTTTSPFDNIDPEYIEHVYIYSLLHQDYGGYDILNPEVSVISDYDIAAARKILELKNEKAGEAVMTDDPEKLAMLHKSISYELNEYASEIILGITSYIGSREIEQEEVPSNNMGEIESEGAGISGGNGTNEVPPPPPPPLTPAILPPPPPVSSMSPDVPQFEMPQVDTAQPLSISTLNPREHATYNSIIDASLKLKQKIEKKYDDANNEGIFGDVNPEVIQNLKVEELRIIDEIMDEYIDAYFYTFDITKSNPTFWLPTPPTNYLDGIRDETSKKEKIKQFFKLKAELNNIVKKYIPESSIDLKTKKLLFFIYNIPSFEGFTSTSQDNETRNIILTEYNIENIQTSISSLFSSSSDPTALINIMKEILFNGQWVPIEDINSNLFAIELFHSSYFEYKAKDIILNSLIDKGVKRGRNDEEDYEEDIKRGRNDEKGEEESKGDDSSMRVVPVYKGKGGAPLQQVKSDPTVCNKAQKICEDIKDFFKELSLETIRTEGIPMINTIIETKHEELIAEMFDSNPTMDTLIYFNKIKSKIVNDYTRLLGRSRDPMKEMITLSSSIERNYDELIKDYCKTYLTEQRKRNDIEKQNRRDRAEEIKRSEEGKINKVWANKLTEYVARASLIITESVIDPANNGSYIVNQEELERIKDGLKLDENAKDKGNWLFYLSTLLVLLNEANYLKINNNNAILNSFISNPDTFIAGITNITGDIDKKTITSTEKILENIFSDNEINEYSNLTLLKDGKTLINNAVTKWPLGLTSSYSFCPMSSINDAQSTCSSYTSEIGNLEIANMNVLFQDSNILKTYNLKNIVRTPPNCRIIVEAYLGNGMEDSVTGIKQKRGNLFISKDIDMNVSSQSADKTLGAVNVLRTVIETMREMWSSIYTSFPTSTPKEINDMCWDAMLTKYNYYNFLECSHLKALGDSIQELNGALKYGGYTDEGIRSYKNNQIYFNTTPIMNATTGRITNRGNNATPSTISGFQSGSIIEFKDNGNAPRGTLSNDRQAGSRSIWLLTCLDDRVINQEAIGGYSSDKQYVLAKASATAFTGVEVRKKVRAIRRTKGGKKTRIIKKTNNKSNKKITKKYKTIN